MTAELARYGAYAIFVLMAIDAVVPAAAELTMLYAGVLAAGHHASLFGVKLTAGVEAYVTLALVGVAGPLVGALLGWAIGAHGGRLLLERHGRRLRIDPRALERADGWFARWGDGAVLLGRLTPVVRSFISIPAGALGSPLWRYTVLSLLASAIWCFGFAAAGWALGGSVAGDRGYADAIAAAGAVVLAVAWLAHRRRLA